MANYVDGYVLPVKKSKVEEYRKMASDAAKVFREYGALEVVECIAEDVKPGKVTSFPQAVDLQPDETVVFSWIVYASRADRDRINKAVMEDPRMKCDANAMPFDSQRMFWGGFEPIVESRG